MSVDEVLRFINNEDKKSKSNKSEKPYSNKNDENINSIDKEVEEFRERIESCAIKCERLKPKVTQEWLEKLKKSILGSRTK